MVGLWPLVTLVYAAITVFALYMTYQEQRQMGRKSLIFNVISYLLCTVWPLLAAGMLVFVQFHPAPAYRADSD